MTRWIIDTLAASVMSAAVWIFLLVTVTSLGVQAMNLWRGEVAAATLLPLGADTYSSGLKFSGEHGAHQGGILAACMLLALLLGFSSRGVLRRLGLLLTVAWCLLWTGNAFWLGWQFGEQGLMLFGSLCAVVSIFAFVRSSRLW